MKRSFHGGHSLHGATMDMRKKPRASVVLGPRGKRAQAWGQELRALNTKTRPHTIYSIKSP
jgi:hypothetical protein